MERKKRTCAACGSQYLYCPQCSEDYDKPSWMFVWDTLECKNVFKIISQYCSKDISKEDAKKALDGVLTHKIKFDDTIEQKIKEIYTENIPKTPQRAKKKIIVTEN